MRGGGGDVVMAKEDEAGMYACSCSLSEGPSVRKCVCFFPYFMCTFRDGPALVFSFSMGWNSRTVEVVGKGGWSAGESRRE